MRIIKYLTLAILLVPFSAQAIVVPVDVWMTPQSSGPYEIDDTFSIEIHAGWDTPVDMMAGALRLDFNQNVINATNVTLVDIAGDLDSSAGTISNTSGFISPIGFSNMMFGHPAGEYHLATVDFIAVGGGVSSLILSDPQHNAFLWGADSQELSFIEPDFSGQNSFPEGSVTVNPVPLPAAAWFMMSGLGFLAFRRKRAA